MTRTQQAVLLLVVGLALGSIGLDGRYLHYLKPAMQVPLLLTAAAFVAVGLAELRTTRRSAPTREDGGSDEHTAHGHAHGHALPRAGWLLVLPVLTIGFVAPPALGAWAAARDPGTVTKPESSDFAPLPAGDPAAIPLSEYGVRAVWDSGRTLTGRTVRLTGFVSPRTGGGWYLTRMTLTCCAADALATKVEVRGAPAPPADTWVHVVGRYAPSAATDPAIAVPALTADTVTPTDEPANPYEE